MSGAAPTPAKTDLFDIDPQAQLLNEAGREDFHSRVAKILFVAKRTRPDLLTAVSFLSTRLQCPTIQDLDKLQRLLKYINGTRDLCTLRPHHQWEVLTFIDASFGVHIDGKGYTGIILLLGQGAFYVASTNIGGQLGSQLPRQSRAGSRTCYSLPGQPVNYEAVRERTFHVISYQTYSHKIFLH